MIVRTLPHVDSAKRWMALAIHQIQEATDRGLAHQCQDQMKELKEICDEYIELYAQTTAYFVEIEEMYGSMGDDPYARGFDYTITAKEERSDSEV
jgi:ATP-dependent protease ClpP protease subunit